MYILKWPRSYIIQDQPHEWGCWSSVLEAVTCYYLGASYNTVGWRPTSVTITNEYDTAGYPSSHVGAASDFKKAIELSGHLGTYVLADMIAVVGGTRRQFRPDMTIWDIIVTEISMKRPIICDMKLTAENARHAVLIYGYSLLGNQVYVADPAPGRSRVDVWDLRTFCTNYRGGAYWRSYATTQPNEWANLRGLFD